MKRRKKYYAFNPTECWLDREEINQMRKMQC